jgi:hypothetical protein
MAENGKLKEVEVYKFGDMVHHNHVHVRLAPPSNSNSADDPDEGSGE